MTSGASAICGYCGSAPQELATAARNTITALHGVLQAIRPFVGTFRYFYNIASAEVIMSDDSFL